MLRAIVSALFIIISFVLQSTLFPMFSVAGGILPNILVIVVCSIAILSGDKAGLWIGFSCGLLCDVFYGDIIGFYALLYMYIGFVNGKFSRIFYPEDIKLPLALILTSDLTYGFVCYVFLFLLRGELEIGWYFLHIIIPEMIYTILVTFVVYPVILLIFTKIEGFERKREQKFV